MTATPNHRYFSEECGSTVVEFGLVAPVMCLLLLGGFDVAHTLYMKAALQGVVQKSARDSSLQSATDTSVQAALDAKVTAQVKNLDTGMSNPQFSRRFYRTFSQASAAQAEPWTDTNNDHTCDNGEPFQDNNGNGAWDADGGNAGQGGAYDKVVYTVTVSYPHLFPFYRLLGGSPNVTLTATTILQNQPFGDQGTYVPATGNCT